LDSTLLNSLRKGGFVLYARHGEANVGVDLPNLNFQNCLTQRNLSDKGRRQAIYYGEILRYLKIPIQIPITATPYCRTIETAQLAFGIGNVRVNPFLSELNLLNGNLQRNDQQRVMNYLTSALEEIPEVGKNKLIIAHSLPEGVGVGPVPYMGTVIVKPKGYGYGYDIVGRIPLTEWSK